MPTAPPAPRAAVLAEDGRPLHLRWVYSRPEIVADGIVHVAGLALALVGLVPLAVLTLGAPLSGLERLAVAIYAGGLLAMLGCSAAYNMWPVGRLKWRLRRADHAAIYVLIAATYTPFVAMADGAATGGAAGAATVGLDGSRLLALLWTVAALGVAIKVALPGRFDRVSIGLYLALGWSGLAAYDAVVATLPSTTLWLLATGGLLYSGGVVFHVWERLRFQNAIWHGFVLAAAACHYGAVLDSVARST